MQNDGNLSAQSLSAVRVTLPYRKDEPYHIYFRNGYVDSAPPPLDYLKRWSERDARKWFRDKGWKVEEV